jgi:hypothetical protein
LVTVLLEQVVEPHKPKRIMLPLLVVLFVISYGLMVLLIVEQDATIGAQRTLIRQMFSDSMDLASLKGKVLREQQQAQAPVHPQSKAPSSQVVPQDSVNGSKAGKMRRPAPMKPPKDTSDKVDERRTLNSI